MGNRSFSSAEMAELEMLVDRHSLSALLDALAHICHEKADHLVSTWRDRHGAAVWTHVGKKISAMARTKAVKEQP